MREHDLQPRRRRRFVATTDSAHGLPVFENLAREVVPDGANQLWNGAIAYVAVASGFVYVELILDAWSVTRLVGPSTPGSPWPRSRPHSPRADLQPGASATATADPSTPRRVTASCLPITGWSDR